MHERPGYCPGVRASGPVTLESLSAPPGIVRMTASIVLDWQSLVIGDVAAVADGAAVSLAPAARARMARTRAIVDAIVERRDVVYGVTTGFGKLSDVAIPHDRLAELQVNLVRSHAAGVG